MIINNNFKKRLEAPEKTNKYYISLSKGGFNKCSEKTEDGHVLPNDVAWVYGRTMEILETNDILLEPKVANEMFNTNDGYSRGNEPKLGAIACWTNEDKTANHVGIVEDILVNGLVKFSNSGNKEVYIRELKSPYNYKGRLGTMKLLGFIYPELKENEKVENFPEEKIQEIKPISSNKNRKTLDELAQEVIDGKWNSGVNRRNRLNKAYKNGRIDFNYDEIQNRVAELTK